MEWDFYLPWKELLLDSLPHRGLIEVLLKNVDQESRKGVYILEVGCGKGNNLLPLMEKGFRVYGIDLSESAIENFRYEGEKRGVFLDKDQAVVGNMSCLPYVNDFFDFVLDREALTHNKKEDIVKSVSEIKRVLRAGGKYIGFDLLGEKHLDKQFGKEINPGTFDFFFDGGLKNSEMTHFFSLKEIKEVFSVFADLNVKRNVVTNEQGTVLSEMFSVVGTKLFE